MTNPSSPIMLSPSLFEDLLFNFHIHKVACDSSAAPCKYQAVLKDDSTRHQVRCCADSERPNLVKGVTLLKVVDCARKLADCTNEVDADMMLT